MAERDKYDEQSSRWLDAIYIAIDKERKEAELEAEKCKRNDEMYGWNFHKGRASGMTQVDLSVRETIRPVFATALREAGQREDALQAEVERLKGEMQSHIDDNNRLIDQHDRLRDEIDKLKALIATVLATLKGDQDQQWPQPHPELLTQCAAAYMTMRDFGAEIAQLKAQLAEAKVRGMEKAATIADKHTCVDNCRYRGCYITIAQAIRAAIAEGKGER